MDKEDKSALILIAQEMFIVIIMFGLGILALAL